MVSEHQHSSIGCDDGTNIQCVKVTVPGGNTSSFGFLAVDMLVWVVFGYLACRCSPLEGSHHLVFHRYLYREARCIYSVAPRQWKSTIEVQMRNWAGGAARGFAAHSIAAAAALLRSWS